MLGGLLCGRAVHCVLQWCTACAGNVMCARAVPEGGILDDRAVYYVLGWCTMW